MWVSRAAWDALEAAHRSERANLEREVEWLREQLVDTLTSLDEAHDHLRRMERVERRLPEQPARPRAADEPMPENLQRVVALFEDGAARQALVTSIDKARQGGKSWEAVYADVVSELPHPVAARLERVH